MHSMTDDVIAHRVRTLADAQGIKLNELAKRSGISGERIRQYLTRRPGASTLLVGEAEALAGALGVQVSYLTREVA